MQEGGLHNSRLRSKLTPNTLESFRAIRGSIFRNNSSANGGHKNNIPTESFVQHPGSEPPRIAGVVKYMWIFCIELSPPLNEIPSFW